MTDLKIRCYWRGVNKMVYFSDPELTWSKDGRVGIFIPADEKAGIYMGESIDMLYSGYRDKKRVEIFDGDIIKCNQGTCVVEFVEGKFSFTKQSDLWLDDWNWADDSSRFTVIGNIHQNPELLLYVQKR